jgi:hypothetical protein
MKNSKYILVALLILFTYSCSEKDLEPTVAEKLPLETSINTVEDLQGLANGMYNSLTAPHYYGRDMIIFGEVRSDNCFANATSGRFVTVGKMQVAPADNYSEDTWKAVYETIASANIIIKQNSAAIEGDEESIKHIFGQAYVIRALAHFDLLRLYGQQNAGGNLGVPYVTTYKGENLTPSRATVEENKVSINNDLESGLQLLSTNLNDASKQTITTYAAEALKARIALYFGDWQGAKNAALSVVNSGMFEIVDAANYPASWKKDSDINSIFELAFDYSDNNGIEGLQYIYRGEKYGDIEVLDNLLTVFSENDVRNTSQMIGILNDKLRNTGKYPSSDFSDNVSLIRYEEVVLIMAEAKIKLAESDALDILNQVPAKRNTDLYTEATLENILIERRKELCFEGFRFDDLARTGSDIPLVDTLHQTHGGPTYGSYNFAFAIPIVEMNANPNMVQNEGFY